MIGNIGPINLDFSGIGSFFDPSKVPTLDLSRFGLGGFPAPVSVAPPVRIPAPPPAPPRPAPVAPKPTFTPPPLKYDRMGRPIVNKIPDYALPPELRVTPSPPVTPRPQPVAPASFTDGLSERLREAMKGKMPTPATDTIGTSGYKRGIGDRPQKSSPPIGAGSPVKLPGERAPDRPAPVGGALEDMLKKMGEISPVQSKPTPVAPKPTPVIGSTAPPALKSRAPTPAPVTPPPVTSTPLPEGVQSGGRYYKNPVTGAPMYQPPMPDLPEGMVGAQVMPPAINLDTGKPEGITLLGDKPTPVTPPATTAPEPTPKPKSVDTSRASVVDAMIASRGKPVSAKSAIQSYKDTLLGAASKNVYDTVDDVDEVDDYYDRVFRNTVIDPLNPKEALYREMAMDIGGEGGGRSYYQAPKAKLSLTPDEYLSEVGGPEHLKGLKSGVGVNKDVVRSAFSTIANTGGADTAAALSSYYGFDIVPTTGTPSIRDFGGNYESHTNASQEQISEFQSLIKPVLAETIPYLQATEGIGYQEALLEAYKRDPMIQSMYAKYGVQPIRQTKDGSTYLYDPMTFGEIRTKEVKDSSVKDALKVAAIVGLSVFGGGALAGTAAFGGGTSAVGSALAHGLTSAGITAATGGDTNDILKSFALAGAGGYAKGLNAAAEASKANLATAALEAGGGGASPALIEAANATAKTADTFGKVVEGAKFVDAAIDGNIAGAAISAFGPKFTKVAMDKVGLDEKFLDGYNINQDDAVAGLVKTELELAKGTDFGDAIARGFGEYIMEGGALAPSNMKTPEFIKKIGDALRYTGSMFDDAILQPVKKATEPLIDATRAVGKTLDDNVFEPVKEVIEDVGSAVDDVVIEPIKEGVEAVAEAVPEEVKDVVEGAAGAVADVASVIPTGALSGALSGAPSSASPTRRSAPRVIREYTPDVAQIGEYERGTDDIAAYLASITGSGMANGGAVRSSYGNLDELLRIVGGR